MSLQDRLESMAKTYVTRGEKCREDLGTLPNEEMNAKLAGVLADYVEDIADVIREAGKEWDDVGLTQAVYDLYCLSGTELGGLARAAGPGNIQVEVFRPQESEGEEEQHG